MILESATDFSTKNLKYHSDYMPKIQWMLKVQRNSEQNANLFNVLKPCSKVHRIFPTNHRRNFPNLKKEMPIIIQKAYRIPNRLDQETKSSHHIRIKRTFRQKNNNK